jgi:phospholipid-translocating ATPase
MDFDCVLSTDKEIKMKSKNKKGQMEERAYHVYRKMDFNSDRKRMSILLKDSIDGKIKLLIKGADSIIKSRLDASQLDQEFDQKMEWFLDTASKQGLRTLLMGMRIVSPEELAKFEADCREAEKDLNNREALLDRAYDEFERKIVLIGGTAVEDRL